MNKNVHDTKTTLLFSNLKVTLKLNTRKQFVQLGSRHFNEL